MPPAAWRSRTRPAPARPRLPARAASYKRDPLPGRILAHRRRRQSGAQAAVAREVERGQARIGLVPDLGRQLVAADVVFERLFVLRAVQHQKAGAWIAD